MVRKTEKDAQVETDEALDQERQAREAGGNPDTPGKPDEPGEQGRNRPNPGRDADRSDDEQARAEQAEKDRPRDEGGNHSNRQAAPDDPAWRGVSGDDEEDKPDQDEVQRRIFEASGMTEDEARQRLARDRGYDPDLPLVSHVEAFETGYAGQVPDRTPNEAYTVSGQVTGEAAAADYAAATRGRTGDEGYELARKVAQRRGGAAPQQPGQDESEQSDDEQR